MTSPGDDGWYTRAEMAIGWHLCVLGALCVSLLFIETVDHSVVALLQDRGSEVD